MPFYYLAAIVAFFAVLWLLVALPQRRLSRRHNEIVAGLEPGQKVMTAGGFHGVVCSLGEDTVELEIAPGVEVTLARGAVAAVLEPEQEPAAEEATGADEASPRDSSS